jgi:hypothetical protein
VEPMKAGGLGIYRNERFILEPATPALELDLAFNQSEPIQCQSGLATSSRPAAISSKALDRALKNSASGCGVPPMALSI